jgi:endo-1,4-beta-D-glucanase Y
LRDDHEFAAHRTTSDEQPAAHSAFALAARPRPWLEEPSETAETREEKAMIDKTPKPGIAALTATAALALTLSGLPAAAAVNHPFGSRPFAYAAGSITPNHVSTAALDQAVRDFYDAWKARYVKQVCGTGRYVVKASVNPGNLTVSEAHGYGMLITALMAGHDPEARRTFDGMYTYFREHPTATHDDLMSWNQNGGCNDVQGNVSASDGDLDIAFALLLADKQWGSCGVIDYAAEALEVIADIKDGELDTSREYVLLGTWVTPAEVEYYPATRSSDFMPDHYRSFAAATADPVWTDVLDRTYLIVDALQSNHSPATGLLPDFVIDPLTVPQPAAPGFLEGPNDGDYDYNACRDPWRLGTDFLVANEARAQTAVQAITTWIRGATGDDPAAIYAGYQLDGSVSPGQDYRSMAFVAPLGVGAMADAANQAWLNAIWDLVVATPLDAEAYYENTLKLLGMIVMSGNWWVPEAVSGGCTPDSTPLCTDGGYVSAAQINLGSLTTDPGRQTLRLKGKLFFPQGTPAIPPFTDGAQVLVQDVGSGSAAIFEVSRFTMPVPPLADGVCDPRDGWNATAQRTIYRNRSTALDPPACTPGTSRGLHFMKYKPRSGYDLDFQAKARRATIAAPVGPLRATLVLGSTQTAGDGGACGISADLVCIGSGGSRRCR